MTIKEYILTCKNFAHDTKDWGGLTDCKFYTTDGVGYWDESPDNAHGGLDIAWAFHRTDEDIEAKAKRRYESQLQQELSDSLDDRDFDLEQWKSVFERYSLPLFDSVYEFRAAADEMLTLIEKNITSLF